MGVPILRFRTLINFSPILLMGCAALRTSPDPCCWPSSILASAQESSARPQIFAPGVVSRDHEFATAFSRSLGQVYVVRRLYLPGTTQPRLTLLESTFAAGEWSAPTPLWFSGKYRDIDPFVSQDGRWMLFNSDRPGPGRDSSRTDFDIWISERSGPGWAAPRRLSDAVNTAADETFATTSSAGDLYYGTSSQTNPRRERRIVHAVPRGNDWVPADTLNSLPAGSGNPRIDAAGRYLLYVATTPTGEGDSDLYVVWRTRNGWGQPCSLGPNINTLDGEFAPAISPDGRLLFFSRIRRGATAGSIEFERVWFVRLAGVLPQSC